MLFSFQVEHPFAADNTILKINVEDPTGVHNKRFKTDPTLVMHEPWFVPRPDSSREDDGVLLIRALDIGENKGRIQS
jgi:carotenoid cleavage dioxygenase-like enzyme